MPGQTITEGKARAERRGRGGAGACRTMLRDHVRWLEGRGGHRATGAGVSLAGADLRDADLRRADLSGQSLRGANLRGAKLGRAVLTGADLSHANLTWTALAEADLRGAMLIGARLAEANLADADLRRAVLRSADLSGAHLAGAQLGGADLIGTNLLGTTWGDGPLRSDLDDDDEGPVLAGTDLRGADLAGFDLRGADLTDADLTGADLRGADLRGARLFRARLAGALLEDADLDGADLEGCDLRGAGALAPDGERPLPAAPKPRGAIRPQVVLAAAIALAVGVAGARIVPAFIGGSDVTVASVASAAPGSVAGAPAPEPFLALRGTGTGSWVEVHERDEKGRMLYTGIIDPGARRQWESSGPLWIRVGDPTGLRATIGGKEHAFRGGTGDFLVTRTGVTRL